MSKKTVTVKARINEDLKKSVEETFSELGLTPSDAIRIFYTRVNLCKGIPFEMNLSCPCGIPHIPNEETKDVLEKSERGEDLINVGDIEGLKKDLGIDC